MQPKTKNFATMSKLFRGAALFIGGAIAGAAAALLMSPKTGEEVRKDLADFASEAKKRAREYCEQVKKEFDEACAAAKAEDIAEAEEVKEN